MLEENQQHCHQGEGHWSQNLYEVLPEKGIKNKKGFGKTWHFLPKLTTLKVLNFYEILIVS